LPVRYVPWKGLTISIAFGMDVSIVLTGLMAVAN